nr:molecular chaperone [uncultured Enterobacter sp.]
MKIIKHLSFSLLAIMTLATAAHASVVMTGTRIIYPAGSREKVLQLTNKDNYPNIVQVWIDKGGKNPTASNADNSFVLTPQMFRVEPMGGQVIRMKYVGPKLPEDRESLFYFNFVQIPSFKSSEHDSNKIVLVLDNRLKVFYRPDHLKGNVNDIGHEIKVKADGLNSASIENPTGYYVNLRRAEMTVNGKKLAFANGVIIPPKSTQQINLPKGKRASPLTLKIVDDYGADNQVDFDI